MAQGENDDLPDDTSVGAPDARQRSRDPLLDVIPPFSDRCEHPR